MTIERADNNLPVQQKAPVVLSRPLTDIDQAWRMANALSKSSLLPDALRNKASDVLSMILYGQDLGLSPMQAIQGIYVVKGKPQMSAQTWIALTRRAGHRITVREHTTEKCTVEITRGDTGESHAETFTIADAETARLTGKDSMYAKYPKRMLLARAVTNCCRFICPEIALGFGAEGEYEEPAASPEQSLARAVDARTPEPETVDGEVHDAEVVEEPAQSDEEIRAEMLDLAEQHQGAAALEADTWPEAAEPGSWGGE
ncbi:MAG: hypothetical protein ACRDP6_24625 [Actinoallomurus sp.]